MTNEQELECNIAAAKMLGHEYIVHDKLASGSVSIKIHSNKTRSFNLFDNPADCQAVVKKLGESDIYLFHTAEGYFVGNEFGENQLYPLYQSKPYEEAVGAACLEA